jgi:hypothetical protein
LIWEETAASALIEAIMGAMGAAAGAGVSGDAATESAGAAAGAAGGSVFRFLLSRFITWAVLLVLESLFEAIVTLLYVYID